MSNSNELAPDSPELPQPTPAPVAAPHDTSDFPPPPVESVAPVEVQENVDLPEKYRGKTLAEVVEMHRNAESELGRARNEVGTIRRLADELIGIRRADLATPAAPAKPPREKLTTDTLLEDPERAITSVVVAEAEARDQDLQQRTARLEAELQLSHFEKRHPDYKQTMEDPKFVEWVQKTPYRARLAQGAIQGNFVAADELFSLYTEASPASTVASPDQNAQVRSAGLVRQGGSVAAGVVQGPQSKKLFSRQELINMRIREPEKFDAMQDEIMLAYREKRVR